MMVEERFLLAAERLRELQKEKALSGEYDTYFKQTADFLGMYAAFTRMYAMGS